MHKERKRRNDIVHSQILFDFADRGIGAPLMSKRSKHAGDNGFERQWLSKEFQSKMLAELGALSVELGFMRTQLLHDYQAQT
jgi:hypothetical protein